MQDLNISLMQTSLSWEAPAANRNHFEQLLNSVPEDTDLAILPEMFTTGFSMNAEDIAEDNKAQTQI